MDLFDVKAAYGRRCPRCGNFSCFEYPNGKNDRKKQSSYYCDSCDPNHKRPIAADRIHGPAVT
jgi:hypothetical protein